MVGQIRKISQELYIFLSFRFKLGQLDLLQHNGMINSEMECANGIKEMCEEFLETSDSAFCRRSQRSRKEKTMNM